MRFRIDEIKDDGLILESSTPWDDLPILVEIASSGDCEFFGPVRLQARAQRVGEMVEIDGTLAIPVKFQCGGCLREYREDLVCRFDLTFARELPVVEDEDSGEEAELTSEDLGITLFHGDEIDLAESIQEQVAISLPVRRRCQPECKGLCSNCGADLNAADCGCSRTNINLKFAALKDFKVDKSS